MSPPITLEAGRDTMPPAGNDAIDIPGSTGCPLPGIGECANDPNLVCTLAPGSGSDAASTRCSPAACNETLTGPDGITAADVPSGHITSARGGVSVTFKFRSSSHVRKVTISCSARDVANALNASVSTVKAGSCDGGSRDGLGCNRNSDCGGGYFCKNGDEYNCGSTRSPAATVTTRLRASLACWR